MSGLHLLKINDPDHVNLRKALRAVVLAPPIFFIADTVFDETLVGVFGFLSAFVALVFADFGGPVIKRAIPYLLLMVFSGLSLVIGSLLADAVFLAGLVMAVIMFIAVFGSVFNAYVPGFVAPVALAFAFAVFIPLNIIDIESRLVGWAIGSLVATVGAVLLWPTSPRTDIREGLQKCALALADALRSHSGGNDPGADLAAAEAALARVRARFGTPLRPAGVGAHDVALYALADHLGHAADLVEELIAETPATEGGPLLDEVIAAFDRAAGSLSGTNRSNNLEASIDRLDQCRIERLKDLRHQVRQSCADDPDADPIPTIRKSFPLLTLSHLVLWVEADLACLIDDAGIVHAVRSAPELAGATGRATTPYQRIRSLVRAHLDSDGVVLRNSIRAGMAMGCGVLLAKLLPFDHGFWIVLGVLSVLRSSAGSTSVTALRAIAGTAVGFVVSALVLLALDGNTSGLWWAMVPMVFLAGYAPGALGFAIGQASFTTMVVFLFDILSPAGVTTALVRLETVSIGAVSAAIVALILWPRGARAALAQAVARVYRTAATGIDRTLAAERPEQDQLARSLESDMRRATAAFMIALGERGERIDAEAWTELLRPPAEVHALLLGLLQPFPQPPEACSGASAAIHAQAVTIGHDLEAVADRLAAADRHARPVDLSDLPSADDALRTCVRACAGGSSEQLADGLVMMAWESWLHRIRAALENTGTAQVSVAGASDRTAWLHWSQRWGSAPRA